MTSKVEEILDLISESNPSSFTALGFDEAIIGIAERSGAEPLLAYDVDKIMSILISQDLTQEEAIDYFDFNIAGAWLG